MGDFFHGWRRKIGVVTLVIACVFAAIWVRLHSKFDYLLISYGSYRGLVVSNGHSFRFISQPSRPIELRTKDEETGQSFIEMWYVHNSRFYPDGFTHRSESTTLKTIAFTDELSQTHDELPMIAYWSIVIPLTLLSAYLLIVKPRPKNLPPKST